MPGGLFESDIDLLCTINKNFSDWRFFFYYISQEEGNNTQPKNNENVEVPKVVTD
jgi:hypothetical protein